MFFSAISIIAAVAVSALVGFLFRQQLEYLAERIKDAKGYRDDDFDTLYAQSHVNKDNISILNNRLKAIEEILQDSDPNPERPIPSDYGFVEADPTTHTQSAWTIKGGEKAFYDALRMYELATAGRVLPKHL